jgi:hypothetical protein
MIDPNNKYLHDSELVFLHKIPKQDIKFQLTLQDLFVRHLMTRLHKLEEKDQRYDYLWPREIRNRISSAAMVARRISQRNSSASFAFSLGVIVRILWNL